MRLDRARSVPRQTASSALPDKGDIRQKDSGDGVEPFSDLGIQRDLQRDERQPDEFDIIALSWWIGYPIRELRSLDPTQKRDALFEPRDLGPNRGL